MLTVACGFVYILIVHVLIFYYCTCDVQDIAQEAARKKRRSTKKPYSRSIVGATLEVIQKRRTEKPEVRDAAREAALRCVFLFISSLFCILYSSVIKNIYNVVIAYMNHLCF